jgi:hypothetical protein
MGINGMKMYSIIFMIVVIPSIASAEVQVRDDVAVTGQPVMLAARTKGLILPMGGELVKFMVDGESLGENLSGGDGWAYREYIPGKEKLYEVEALSGEDAGSGYLLALKEGAGIIFVDVQGALVIPPFSREPREGSLESLKRISDKYSIVYLYTEFPSLVIRKWLSENAFPDAPLLNWRSGGVFDYVSEKGLKVRAVVGSAAVAGSALEQEGAKLFTFDSSTSPELTEADSWDEVEKALLK